MNSDYERSIYLDESVHQEKVKVLDFAFSNAESRLGAVMRDNTIGLWDTKDDFKLEMTMNTKGHAQIFYVEFCQTWMTVDPFHVIHSWDLLYQNCEAFAAKHS
jgi:hypothetical protein